MEWIDQLKPLIAWIHMHPGWAGIITFLIAMSESLAVVGLIVPGSIIMSAIGTLVGAKVVPVIPTFFWAILGAIVGDIISYHLGSKFNHRIPNMWPFCRYPHWLQKAQDFFQRHGRKSIFLGRFVGPMRPITPLVAGMMKMPIWRFYTASIIASSLWAPIYMLPGILIGAASQELEPATATRFLITVVVLLIILWLTMWILKWIILLAVRSLNFTIHNLWVYLQQTPLSKSLCAWIRDPNAPESHSQLVLLVSWLFIGFFTIFFIWNILHLGWVTHWNEPLRQLVLNLHVNMLTHFFVVCALFSTQSVLFFAFFCSLLWLLWKRLWQAAWLWVFNLILILLIVSCCNIFIFYPPPSGLVQILTGNSFPSNQTAITVALFGFLGVLVARPITISLRRQMIYSSLASLCVVIILARLYLGIHWFTDILTGGLLGLWVLLLCSLLYRRLPIYNVGGGKLSAIFFLSLTLGWGIQMLQNYHDYIVSFTPFWPTYQITQDNWWAQSMSSQPLYRTNRIGKPVQIMNVQWLGSTEEITTALQNAGWKIQPKPGLISTINNLSSHDKQKKRPLLQPLYLGEKPSLVATKQGKGLKQMVLLQLWSSKINLTDSTTPLWIGTIEYQLPHPYKFWQRHHYQNKYINLPPPINELYLLKADYDTKLVYYPASHRPPSIPAYEWNGGVIFINVNTGNKITQSR